MFYSYILLGSKFPVPGDKDVCLPPGPGRAFFMWEVYFLFPGRQGEEGQECFSCTGGFSSNFILFFYCIFSITIYPTYALFHLHPHPPQPLQSLHSCPCLWVLFLFCSILLPPNPSTQESCQPALYLWVCLCFAYWFSLFIRFHTWVRSYGSILSLTGLFHLAYCSPGPYWCKG